MNVLLKKPSAWLPLVMSFVAFALLVGYVVIFGKGDSSSDEGTAAHLFQLLMGGQLPVVAYFVLSSFSRDSFNVVKILALQIFAALVPFTLLFFFER